MGKSRLRVGGVGIRGLPLLDDMAPDNIAGCGPGGMGLKGFSKSEQYAESRPRDGGVFTESSRCRGLGTAIGVVRPCC